MALHAQGTKTYICHRGAFGESVNVGRAQLVRVGRIVGIMTGCAGNGFVNRVGGVRVCVTGMINEILEPASCVATNAIDPGRAGRSARGDGMPGILPFGGSIMMR
jgi:hypothetical protein